MSRLRSPFITAAVGALIVSLCGCGISIPADPGGTTDSVTGSTLRVGVALEPDLVEVKNGTPTGPLADLTVGFADQLHATPEWVYRGEESLVTLLEAGDIDLAIGGFTDQTPWADRAGVSRGYSLGGGPERQTVFLVPLGENRFLSELETYLDHETAHSESDEGES